MAISIDSVYQRVLALANKEQRGYITPQEFNLLANKAQMDIFEAYFHEVGALGLTKGNDTEYGDELNILREKISPFEKWKVDMSALNNTNELTLPTSTAVHKLGTVFYGANSRKITIKCPVGTSVGDGDILQLRFDPDGDGDFLTLIVIFDNDSNVVDGALPAQNALQPRFFVNYSSDDTGTALATRFAATLRTMNWFNVTQSGDTLTIEYKQPTNVESTEVVTSHLLSTNANFVVTVVNTGATAGNNLYDVVVERVDKKDLHYMERSSKINPMSSRPVYVRKNDSVIKIFPSSPTPAYATSNVTCNYIAKPADPKWTYVVVNDKALYNASDTSKQDFDLHASEESTLVNSILELAGIVIAKPGLSEVAIRNEQMKVENRK